MKTKAKIGVVLVEGEDGGANSIKIISAIGKLSPQELSMIIVHVESMLQDLKDSFKKHFIKKEDLKDEDLFGMS